MTKLYALLTDMGKQQAELEYLRGLPHIRVMVGSDYILKLDGSDIPFDLRLGIVNDGPTLTGAYDVSLGKLSSITVSPRMAVIENVVVNIFKVKTRGGITEMSTYTRGAWVLLKGKPPTNRKSRSGKARTLVGTIRMPRDLVLLEEPDGRTWILQWSG